MRRHQLPLRLYAFATLSQTFCGAVPNVMTRDWCAGDRVRRRRSAWPAPANATPGRLKSDAPRPDEQACLLVLDENQLRSCAPATSGQIELEAISASFSCAPPATRIRIAVLGELVTGCDWASTKCYLHFAHLVASRISTISGIERLASARCERRRPMTRPKTGAQGTTSATSNPRASARAGAKDGQVTGGCLRPRQQKDHTPGPHPHRREMAPRRHRLRDRSRQPTSAPHPPGAAGCRRAGVTGRGI